MGQRMALTPSSDLNWRQSLQLAKASCCIQLSQLEPLATVDVSSYLADIVDKYLQERRLWYDTDDAPKKRIIYIP